MTKLEQFMELLTGNFNNAEQYQRMQEENKPFPYAEHANHACNDKIRNLPKDFSGVFMVEESYYTSAPCLPLL